jgi:hypothetical protein
MNAAQDILMAFVAAFDQHDPDGTGELWLDGSSAGLIGATVNAIVITHPGELCRCGRRRR